MPQPAPVLQCGHHLPPGLAIAFTSMTLQHSVQPSQLRTVLGWATLASATIVSVGIPADRVPLSVSAVAPDAVWLIQPPPRPQPVGDRRYLAALLHVEADLRPRVALGGVHQV